MSSYKWFNVAFFDGHAITFHPNRILRQTHMVTFILQNNAHTLVSLPQIGHIHF